MMFRQINSVRGCVTGNIRRQHLSVYASIQSAPADKILGLNEAFKENKSPQKVNLIVGAYRDDNGKPSVLESVRTAEERIFKRNVDHEYAGIAGVPSFVEKSLEFAYGKNNRIFSEKRVAAVQALSGTGACRLATEFINSHVKTGDFYLPNPTWANHINICKESGLKPLQYPYYDEVKRDFDFQAMKSFIASCPANSWFMLHACAHNPTGYDPTPKQWQELSDIILQHKHNVLFDCAYQGFASGDADLDAYAVRLFVEQGHNIILAQSFAKNFGLYGERVGTLSVVTSSKEEADAVGSQLKRLARAMYSNPPIYGARIVVEILSDDSLSTLWRGECKAMADRIIAMRHLLVSELKSAGSKRDWGHITTQIGMFSYLGLTKEQVLKLRSEFHIFCTEDSRISIAGVNTANAAYIAKAIHQITSS